MTQHKLTYEPEEAARFLGITPQQLALLTTLNHIRKQYYQKREFYLAGELDAVKPNIENLVEQFTTPKPPKLPLCDPSCHIREKFAFSA